MGKGELRSFISRFDGLFCFVPFWCAAVNLDDLYGAFVDLTNYWSIDIRAVYLGPRLIKTTNASKKRKHADEYLQTNRQLIHSN